MRAASCPEPFDYHDDKRVIEFGIGLTDLVKRPSKTVEELSRADFAEGRIVLSQKLEEFAPRVVAFNGKLTYEQFAQRKCKFGLQKEPLYGARVYVLPATPSQDGDKKSEKLVHFRKLAQLVKRIEKERDYPEADRRRDEHYSADRSGTVPDPGKARRRRCHADLEPPRQAECAEYSIWRWR